MSLPYGLASFFQLCIFYSIVFVTLVYLLKKYYYSKFYILIVFLFYPAFFEFFGMNVGNAYKVFVLIFTLWISFRKNIYLSFNSGDKLITFFFVVFSFFFFVSTSKNDDDLTTILSQFSRYVIAYYLWFLVRKEIYYNQAKIEDFKRFIYDVIFMQIIINIGKLIIFSGKQIEHIVGSLTLIGGGHATIITIFGFIFLWLYRRGNFKFKDFLYIFGLILIGFLAGKRAIWYMMPIVIFLFMVYIPNKKINSTIFFTILLMPIVFYFGIRLTPTLNPDNKIWGRFSIDHIMEYGNKYQFGDNTKENKLVAQGRGGATLSLFNKLYSDVVLNDKDWFGLGLTIMYNTSYEEFQNFKTGLNMKGSASGIYQTYITTGYMGVLSTIFLFSPMLLNIKIRRIRLVLTLIVCWEYFMYIGLIFRVPAFMFLLVFFIHYFNYSLIKIKKIEVVHS